MPTGRGLVVFLAGLGMWLTARLLGSPALAVVGVGLAFLPFAAAALARWGRQRVGATRRLSEIRVNPGTRVVVELSVENRSHAATSFLMLEDQLPAALGRPARLVLTGIPSRGLQRVSYTLVPQARGRYRIGPLTVDLSDPFALSRLRLEFDDRDDLIVTPELEDLQSAPDSPSGANVGLSRARNLFRTGEEFYTMRQYQQGDDLRRIHWPSVARSGELMIRQDESSRRSSALLFADTRMGTVGQAHSPAFEKVISATASIGVLMARNGFTLRVATADMPPVQVSQEGFLDTLTAATHSKTRSIGPALARLRTGSGADTTLIYVAAPLLAPELSPLIRAGAAFGPKLAVLVYPVDPHTLPPERQAQLEGRASQARLSLSRAGWDVLVLPPSARLKDLWHTTRARPLVVSASSR
ncbi:MAG: DUF58 domain-containing protein [Actinomycetota bacterium]